MKAIWSGSISFGLLNIPIHVYSAIAEHKFGFNMLCGTCHKKLKNIRWCEHCKKVVAWDDTVRGFKTSKDSYIVLTEEAIQKLKPEKMDIIDIKEFVPQSELEMLYINNHYYMMPSKAKDKAFYLFAQALQKSKRMAIGKFVMHDKEHVVAISFYKNMLLLNTLHYMHEIRNAELEELKTIKISKQELDLAMILINRLTHKTLTLDKYKNTFVEKLKKALQSHKKGKIMSKKPVKKPKEKEQSLAATLKESLHASRR